jgi:hypothetical protein
VADPGRLSTQYQRASRAASAIEEAVEELRAQPVGQVGRNGSDLGRYLASVAGLIDPAYVEDIDAEFVNIVPNSLLTDLGTRRESDPEIAHRLLSTANDLIAGRRLGEAQVELVQDVADVATQGALQLSQEILAH